MSAVQPNTAKIAIVDNHVLFMEGLISLFENTSIQVVGKASSLKSLLTVLNHSPEIEIILLDLNLEKEDGFLIVDHLRKNGYPQKIIILTMYDSPRIISKVKQINVEGYVLKNTSKENLLAAIAEVKEGQTHYDEAEHGSVYQEPEIKYVDDFIKKHNLSEREYEVLILLAKSYSTKEIAELLFISEQTVSTYRKYIKSKLQLKSIADIVRYAFINKLL